MESLSAITSLINFFKNLPAWILKKFDRKIVKIDDYKDETLEVDFDYPSKSPQCIEETKNGAKFYWSEKLIFRETITHLDIFLYLFDNCFNI